MLNMTNRQRERLRNKRAAGSRAIAAVTIATRSIASATNFSENAQEPRPGTKAYVEWDSNADTCCLGENFTILSYSQRIAEVFPYDQTMPSVKVPIVTRETAYACPETGETFIFVVNEGLYYDAKLDHSLFNQMQIRKHGMLVWDNPFNKDRPFGMEIPQVFVPFHTNGIKVQFKTRAPTSHELKNCLHIDLTRRTPWNPQEVTISKTDTQTDESLIDIDDPRGNNHALQSIDPILDPGQWQIISQVGTYNPRSLDVPTRATFKSSEQHE